MVGAERGRQFFFVTDAVLGAENRRFAFRPERPRNVAIADSVSYDFTATIARSASTGTTSLSSRGAYTIRAESRRNTSPRNVPTAP